MAMIFRDGRWVSAEAPEGMVTHTSFDGRGDETPRDRGQRRPPSPGPGWTWDEQRGIWVPPVNQPPRPPPDERTPPPRDDIPPPYEEQPPEETPQPPPEDRPPLGQPEGQPRPQFEYRGFPDYEKQLQERVAGAPAARQFTFQGRTVNVPTFQPRTNPFQEQLQGAIRGGLERPSRYDTDIAQQTYAALSGQMSRGFRDREARLTADAARRGVYYGTPLTSGLSTLAGDQALAEQSLVADILRDQARTLGADRESMIRMGLAGEEQRFGQQRDIFGAGMARAGMERGLEQDRYGREQSQFQTQEGAEQRAEDVFRQRMQDALGFGQQSFENQLRVAGFNAGQMGDLERLLMQLLGGGQA